MSFRDPYVVLGVSSAATNDEIRAAFRRLVLREHPDQHDGSPAANARLREVVTAFEALKTPEARAWTDVVLSFNVQDQRQTCVTEDPVSRTRAFSARTWIAAVFYAATGGFLVAAARMFERKGAP